MRDATLCFLIQGTPASHVLLGRKKNGFGAGKINGIGGKVEEGETIVGAAVRELGEEVGISVSEQNLESVAHLTFCFPAAPDWDQTVHVFVAREWQGAPRESGEMSPAWYAVDTIPYTRMWQDDQHWLPRVLAGEWVRAWFRFADDNESIADCGIEEWVEADTPAGRHHRAEKHPTP